jgi:phospholipase/carboxylesterase
VETFDTRVTRRRFTATAGHALGAITFGAIGFGDACLVSTETERADAARLTARPRDTVAASIRSGRLGLGQAERDGVIQLPSAYQAGPVPLLVFLHGATQNGAGMLRRIGAAADEAGVAILAPDSRGTTWDAIRGRFGDDVAFLNRALDHVFAQLPVDPDRLAVGGFSDGASYAISLGLANGDLFPRVVACSPGFVISTAAHGRPRVFVSHGIADQILPIDRCSRIIVPRLRSMGYEVTFREFEGRHEMPAGVVNEALRWIEAR